MLIGTAVVSATTMIFDVVVLTNRLTQNTELLSILHPPFLLGLITGSAMIYWFTGASTQAVTTGAYAVEFIKANIRLEGIEKASVADSKEGRRDLREYAEGHVQHLPRGVLQHAQVRLLDPYFFISLISIALFGLCRPSSWRTRAARGTTRRRSSKSN